MTTPIHDVPSRAASDALIPDVIPDSSGAIALAVKGEVDAQISTAKAYPRDIREFLMELRTMATLTTDVAASCFYKLRRKEKDGSSKTIEGPSVRFAELACYAYRNARIQARTSHDDGSYVYCLGTALDLERNVGIQTEVRRRITTREGKRFSDDMVAVTANAGNSIALRNAAFRMIPRALWEPIYEEAKKTAIGSQKSFQDRKADMVAHFTNKVGLTVDELCAYLDIPNLESMTFEHLEDAIGLATGLKDGDIKIDEVKAKAAPATPAAATTAPATGTPLQNLTEKLKQEQQAQPAATPPVESSVETSSQRGQARSHEPREMPSTASGTVGGPSTDGPESMSREESNALDLELANEEAKQEPIADQVKKLAEQKTMPPVKSSKK